MTADRGAYDPLEPLAGFEARRSGAARSDEAERPTTARRAAPATAPVVVPFGTWDKNLVRYTVLIDAPLDALVAERVERGVPFGQLAFEAITEQYHRIVELLVPASDVPYRHLRTHRPAPLAPGAPHSRRTGRITVDQALAIQDIRERLGRIELGQLHRFALALHLDQ